MAELDEERIAMQHAAWTVAHRFAFDRLRAIGWMLPLTYVDDATLRRRVDEAVDTLADSYGERIDREVVEAALFFVPSPIKDDG